METQVIVTLIGAGCTVLTIIGTLSGTYLGAILNRSSALKTASALAEVERHKYTQDRLWDFRKESYSIITSSLIDAARSANIINDGYNDGERHPEEYNGSEDERRHSSELWMKWAKSLAEVDRSRLLLSDDFVARVEEIRRALDGVNENDVPPVIASEIANVFEKYLPRLIGVAKAEIAPQMPKVS